MGRSIASRIRSSLVFTGLLLSAQVFSADKTETCVACHGPKGVSSTPLTPSLAGQPSFFLVAQLFLFREQRRDNALMNAMAKDLKDADLQSLADYFTKLPPPSRAGNPDPAKVKRGRVVLEEHNCLGCHGKD